MVRWESPMYENNAESSEMFAAFERWITADFYAGRHVRRIFSTMLSRNQERRLTFGRYGHILTNCGVWSADGEWIVYDTRSDAAGAVFDGERIEAVHVETGEVR